MEYLVDVIVPIYNHEKYLVKTFDGILMQETDFKFRVIASDDCSTDGTRAIMQRYAEKYPDIIFPTYHPKNMGALANGYSILSKVTSKYVAVCDGDDYWTDKHKLQKQISFLEANPDFTVCFGKVDIIDELGLNLPPERFFPPLSKDVYTIEDFITTDMHLIPTPTLVYRNELPHPIPEYYLSIFSADAFIIMIELDKGKAKFMDETMAVYRNHSGGMTKTVENRDKVDTAKFELFEYMNNYLGYRHDKAFRKKLLDMTRVRIMFGSRNMGFWQRVKNVMKNRRNYVKYSDGLNLKEVAYYTTVLFFPRLLKLKR